MCNTVSALYVPARHTVHDPPSPFVYPAPHVNVEATVCKTHINTTTVPIPLRSDIYSHNDNCYMYI